VLKNIPLVLRTSLTNILGAIIFIAGLPIAAAAPSAILSTHAYGEDPTIKSQRSINWSGAQNIFVPRLGRVRFNFDSSLNVKNSYSTGALTLKRVTAAVAGSPETVVASYSNIGNSSPEILFNARNPRTGRITFARITASGNSGGTKFLRVASVPSSILSSIHCGTNKATRTMANAALDVTRSDSLKTAKRASAITVNSGPTIRVAFVADAKYSKRFGVRTEQHVVTMLDQVNVIYARDLGFSITPVLVAREKNAVSNLRSSDSSGLLDGFAVLAGRARYGEANVYHLLTGKDLSDNIIGLANLPGACAPKRSMRVSLSQYLNAAVDYMTIAHEIGHNLSAEHDSVTSPSTLMFPSLPVESVKFSSFSQSQIEQFESYSDIRACFNAAVPARSAVALKVTLASNGAAVLAMSLPTTGEMCSVQLDVSPTADHAAPTSAKFSSFDALSLRVFTNINRRPVGAKRVFVRVTATCGKSVSSAQTSVATSVLSKSLGVTSVNGWISSFVSALR